jgi:hypothetical protein
LALFSDSAGLKQGLTISSISLSPCLGSANSPSESDMTRVGGEDLRCFYPASRFFFFGLGTMGLGQ